MQNSKIDLSKYQEWISVDKLIQPREKILITPDRLSLPKLNLLSNRVYLQVEPEVIVPSRQFILQTWRRFKHIITYDDVVLSRCPNAVKYLFGTCLLQQKDYDNIDTSLKNFRISSLVGSKVLAYGHVVRLDLYVRQKEFVEFPLAIYRSTRDKQLPDISNNLLLPEDNKIHLFKEFQFSIVIENSQQANYFTEKLVDCLITKTIPIYWGCPNISEYFDTTGWIVFTDIDDLKSKLLLLNDSYYLKYTDVINKNYETAKLYTDFHENVNRAIRTIPNW